MSVDETANSPSSSGSPSPSGSPPGSPQIGPTGMGFMGMGPTGMGFTGMEGGAPWSNMFDSSFEKLRKMPGLTQVYTDAIGTLQDMSTDPNATEAAAMTAIGVLKAEGARIRGEPIPPAQVPVVPVADAAPLGVTGGAPGGAPGGTGSTGNVNMGAPTLLTNTDGSVRVPAPAPTLLTNTDGSVRAAGSMSGSSRKTRHRTPKRRRSAKSKGRKKLSKKKTGSRK